MTGTRQIVPYSNALNTLDPPLPGFASFSFHPILQISCFCRSAPDRSGFFSWFAFSGRANSRLQEFADYPLGSRNLVQKKAPEKISNEPERTTLSIRLSVILTLCCHKINFSGLFFFFGKGHARVLLYERHGVEDLTSLLVRKRRSLPWHHVRSNLLISVYDHAFAA
jgi:hypothetical protein